MILNARHYLHFLLIFPFSKTLFFELIVKVWLVWERSRLTGLETMTTWRLYVHCWFRFLVAHKQFCCDCTVRQFLRYSVLTFVSPRTSHLCYEYCTGITYPEFWEYDWKERLILPFLISFLLHWSQCPVLSSQSNFSVLHFAFTCSVQYRFFRYFFIKFHDYRR